MAAIAVLFHERTTDPADYKVHYLAEFWRQAGHRVAYLFGTRRHVPADVLLLHVDLSIVPRTYVRFSERYPIVLNRYLIDIRKSRISNSLIHPDDVWEGPVIVKSDLNYGGKPERDKKRAAERFLWRVAERTCRRFRIPISHPKPLNYTVFSSYAEVPKSLVNKRGIVIEKFTPEIDDGLYRIRIHQVLGDRWTSTRLASREPIVKAHNNLLSEEVEPHPIVDKWRQDLRVDYGKLDYVVVDGEAILLDVNKTIGTLARDDASGSVLSMRRHLAEGIGIYLSQ